MTKMWPALLVALLLVTAVLVVVALIGRDRLWVILLGPEDRAEVDFATLIRTGRPNSYLVCPPGMGCANVDGTSPEWSVPVDLLRNEFVRLAGEQPRTRLLKKYSDLQFDFEQRSRWFRFPDTVSVRFVPLSGNRSTLALYSRSSYGYSDLGVNRDRVDDWLGQLKIRLEEREKD